MHKHDLRQNFHRQLKTLWNHPPLAGHASLLQPKNSDAYSSLRSLGDFIFAPLVTAEMNLVAELNITLMRPEPAGNLITQGGDIDNRLKTLLDALTMPRHKNALPNCAPTADQTPFFCLLEDDNLVTAVSVRTEHLLEPDIDVSDIDLTVQVKAYPTLITWDNSAFG